MKKEADIIICGDICPTKDTRHLFEQANAKLLFNNVLEIFDKSDFVFGNLEFVLTDNARAIKKAGPVLYGKTNFINLFKKAGFDALSLANNHIKDCGEVGVKSTLEACRKVEIDPFGAGANLKEAKQPYIKNINGIKLGFIAFAEQEFNCASDSEYGASFFDPLEDLDLIKEVKDQVDYLVVIYHGGVEYYEYPSPLLQKKCRKFIDKGADYVTCQHSHCVGTIEEYKEKKILYGQGNTIFGYRERNDSWNQGLLVRLKIIKEKNKVIVNTELLPIHAVKNGIELMESGKVKTLLEALNTRSLKIHEEGFVETSWSEFCITKKWLYLPWLFGFNRYLIHLNRVLSQAIINTFYKNRQKTTTLNIIRCEAHNEVVQELLKDK